MSTNKASEKLMEIFQPQEFLYSDEEDDTTAKTVSHDDLEEDDPHKTQKRSSLRVKNVQLLDDGDERYSGSKVSRRSLKDFAEDEEDEQLEVDEDDNEGSDSVGMVEDEDEDELGSDNSEDNSDEDEEMEMEEVEGVDDRESGSGPDASSEDESDLLANISGRDAKEEIAKGRATQNQLRIFDMLLEARIRLQKMLIESNKLPQNQVYESLVNNDMGGELSCNPSQCQSTFKMLLDNFIQFQDHLFQANSETKKAMKSKRKHSEEDGEDSGHEDAEMVPKKKQTKLDDYDNEIRTRFTAFVPFRNETIHKWNEKTQTLSKNFASFKTPILKQVEHILKDKERLVKRTQTKRSEYTIIGATATEAQAEGCEEIYDDDDFYHQLLRELIERKTTDVNEPGQLSRHWLELQKLRSKMKRKIDTKASKGRRIRYEVHSKLVNFMASYDSCPMTENAMSELFVSLFGATLT